MTKFRSTASFGKRQEFAAISELLRRDFDVYLTLVDDQQIDCIVRREVKGRPVYLDIQIKARSKQCLPRQAGTFAMITVKKPRPNFFFIFYSEQACPACDDSPGRGCYWVMPSLDVVREANSRKTGANIGSYRLALTNVHRRTGLVRPRPRFEKYLDDFDALRHYKG